MHARKPVAALLLTTALPAMVGLGAEQAPRLLDAARAEVTGVTAVGLLSHGDADLHAVNDNGQRRWRWVSAK